MTARLRRHAALVLALFGFAAASTHACAQAGGAYCEPAVGTKFLYTDRGYLIEPKPAGASSIEYRYLILGTQRHVERYGQFLFDDGGDRWAFESNPQGLGEFWPLTMRKHLDIERYDRYTRAHAFVSLRVEGTEPVEVGDRGYSSWRVERQDRLEDKSTTSQTLWYSPELCTLTQFTDSQERTVTLLRILHPGDRDYNRPVVRRLHRLYWGDTNQPVK